MARTNPQLEALQRENAMLRKWIDSMRADPGDIPLVACDNSCVCARPEGMATNGGCRCDEHKLRRAVQWWRRVAEFRLVTIREMKGQGT
jgi:hypothetical protein